VLVGLHEESLGVFSFGVIVTDNKVIFRFLGFFGAMDFLGLSFRTPFEYCKRLIMLVGRMVELILY
jgi:hypothetical protein